MFTVYIMREIRDVDCVMSTLRKMCTVYIMKEMRTVYIMKETRTVYIMKEMCTAATLVKLEDSGGLLST